MFTLIITIIAIALVAALAIASIYYGGSAFTQGSAKSNASALVAQAQQIAGANDLYANDKSGAFDTSIGDLVSGGYLASQPQIPSDVGGTWAVDSSNNVTDAGVTNQTVCEEINAEATGVSTLTAPPSAQQTSQTFGCYGTASPFTVFYTGA